MTAYSTQGYTIRLDGESALGVAANAPDKDIRLAEAPTLPVATRELEAQPNIGHENAADVRDRPLPFETVRESSLVLPIHVRRGLLTAYPPLIYFLKSGGWTITDSVVDTVTSGAPAVGSFDCSASIFGAADTYGGAVLVETTANAKWTPCLLALYDDAPSKTCTPVMDLPSIAAVGGDVKRMYTATVNPAPIDAADTLQFVYAGRGLHTSAPDLAWTYAGCALADLGEIAINRDGAVVLKPSFHVADISNVAETMNAASFLEGGTTAGSASHYQRNESSNFAFRMTAFDAAGGITAAPQQMISATIRPNITTVVIPGIGSTSCLNGIQGYMQRVAAPEVDVTILMDQDYIDDASKGVEALTGNQFTYLEFTWATTSMEVPASGIWLPKCYQYAPPDFDLFNETTIMCTLHFRASAPEYTGSPTTNGSPGMSPIVIAIHSQAS